MIKNIIFDFGDVFINLDKEIIYKEMAKYGGSAEPTEALLVLNAAYEVGAISSDEFIAALAATYPKATKDEIANIWNSMLLDLPNYRLKFLEELSQEKEYKLFLLSNTNDLHITKVQEKLGSEKYERFKNCFDEFYLSHEIQLRKPNYDIYEFVLRQNKLVAEETLFIDDTKENTDAASQLGIQYWHLQVGKEDIITLKSKIADA